MKYRKKPIIVNVILWDGGNKKEVESFVGEPINHAYSTYNDVIVIKTLEGDMFVNKGDLIIKGVNGEFYPCRPDIFNKTYEKVAEKEPTKVCPFMSSHLHKDGYNITRCIEDDCMAWNTDIKGIWGCSLCRR